MSLSLLTTLPCFLSSCPSSSQNRKRSNSLTVITKNHRLVHTFCEHKQSHEGQNQWITSRRSALVGLGVLTVTSVGLITQPAMATVPEPLTEFGPNPRPLDSTIRVLVPRVPKPQNELGGEDEIVEVLMVDGVEVKDNNPVRLDVYVAKPDGDRSGSDLGELAGSLVDLARLRVRSRVRRLGLNLGITNLVKEIGAEKSDKLLVSLVPGTGNMIVSGVHIENWKAE